MPKKKFIFGCLLVACSIYTQAQFIQDAAGVSFTTFGGNHFTDAPAGHALGDNDFTLNTLDVWAPLPLIKGKKTIVFSTINYRQMQFDFEQDDALQSYDPQKIHEAKAMIVLKSSLSQRWSIIGIALPTVASDFEGSLEGDDFIADGVLTAARKFGRNQNFELGFGVYAMYSFNEVMVTPAISLDYLSNNKKWVAQFYWPRLNVFYNLSQGSQIGVAGSIHFNRYNLVNYNDSQNREVDYAEYTSIQNGLQFNQRLFSNVWLQLQGGMSVANGYKRFDVNNNEVLSLSADNSFYGKAMLTNRFQGPLN